MKRVDKLLLKVKAEIQAAQRLDEDVFCYALVSPARYVEVTENEDLLDKWVTLVYLNKGTPKSPGTMLDPLYYDTQEEALAAAKEIEAVHAPTGGKVKIQDPVYITITAPGKEEAANE